MSATINRRSPRHHAVTGDHAAIESARYERMQQLDDIAAVFSLALRTAERSGDADAVRRIRGARSLLSERLGLRGD